jgi:hypothetical protein
MEGVHWCANQGIDETGPQVLRDFDDVVAELAGGHFFEDFLNLSGLSGI